MIGIKISVQNDFIKKLADKQQWVKFQNRLLQNVGNEGLRFIKLYAENTFKHQTGNYIAKTKKRIEGSKLIIETLTPYANRLEKGNKEEPMLWLVGKGPIPIKWKNGSTHFY